MPQIQTLRRLPLLRAVVGLLSTLTLAGIVGSLAWITPQHASASDRVLTRFDVDTSATATPADSWIARSGAMVRSQVALAPAAAVSGTPYESQHPDAPMEDAEAPETGEGSIEAGDDLSDFDDFAYHLRVVFDGAAPLNREIERGMSLGGRAASRLEDNRSDKPPRG